MSPEAINVACAERLGWKIERRGEGSAEVVCISGPGEDTGWKFADSGVFGVIPNFHGSLDAAERLVEKAKEMGFSVNMDNKGLWCVYFFQWPDNNGRGGIEARNESRSAAICEAFLKLPPCP